MKGSEQMLIFGGQIGPVRDERIDSVKYWLILVVIIGHVFRCLNSEQPECAALCNWIYIFHMPLFVFISGYFCHKKDSKNFIRDCRKLIEPLIIVQFLVRVCQYITEGTITWSEIFTPWFALWYLLSLVFWRGMIQIIPNKYLNNAKLVILSSFIIGLLAGFTPCHRVLSLQRTLSFLPFFFLGYCMKGKNLFIPSKYRPLSFIFLVAIYILIYHYYPYLVNLSQADPYGDHYDLLRRIVAFCLCIPMSVAFINICPNILWTAKQGKLTLQYYIYHTLIIYVLSVFSRMFDFPVSFVALMVYSLIIILGLGLASYLPYFQYFSNPTSFFKRIKKATTRVTL